jgi:hypothetical protein
VSDHTCSACRGNVGPGRVCYACGRQGPAGEGQDLDYSHAALEHLRRTGAIVVSGGAATRAGALHVHVGTVERSGAPEDLLSALAEVPDGAGVEAVLRALEPWRADRA